jgi:cobalt-zinc-cadmium efflux system membrane fusion protein
MVNRATLGRMLALTFAVGLMTACGGSEAERPRAETPPGAGAAAAASARPNAESGVITITRDSPRMRQISVQPVEVRPVAVDEVVAPGRVTVDPHRAAKVLLPVPGRIVGISVRLGEAVERGQAVVAVESPEADGALAAHRQAAAAQRQSEAALVKARTDLARVRDLYAHGAAAAKEVLVAENDLAQVDAAVETASAVKTQAGWKLQLLGLNAGVTRPWRSPRPPANTGAIPRRP